MRRKGRITGCGVFAAALVAFAGATDTTAQTVQEQARHLARQALANDPNLRYDPFGVLIRFRADTPEHVRADIRARVGGEVVRTYSLVPGLEKITTFLTVEETIWLLTDLDAIEYVEPDFVIRTSGKPNDTNFNKQWGAHNVGQRIGPTNGVKDADMDLREGWDLDTGDPDSVIAVIDSGVDRLHPDLIDNLWTNTGEVPSNGIDDDVNGFIDDTHGWDFHSDDNDPQDIDGHGTSVAGIIGARGNNGAGIAGVMWRCQLMILRVFEGGAGFVSDAVAALGYAADQNVPISNNSWGSYDFSQALLDAIDALQAFDHVFVAAAGNDANDNDSNPYYPASYDIDHIIAVAATNHLDGLANFSNYGAEAVDVGAPGARVFTTKLNASFGFFSGTSAAAPQVAGLIALAKVIHPEWSHQHIRRRMINQARDIDALAGVTVSEGVPNAPLLVEQPVARPDDPTTEDLGSGFVSVNWGDNADNENRYIVQRMRKVSTGVWSNRTNVAELPANTETFTDASGFGVFKYRVRARNRGYWSAWTRWSIVAAR